MRSKPLCKFLLLFAFFATTSPQLAAQNYRFRVEELDLQVYVQPDASARLEYKIVFANQPNADAIDVVDIGLPHRDYRIGTMSATIDGQGLNAIRKSEYIDVGVEVPVIPIAAGKRGTFRFQCTMPDMVYQDTTDKERASLQIIPTWFDPSLQVGDTHLRIAIHLPASIKPDELTYHSEDNRYHQKVLFGDGDAKHVVAIWDWPNHRLSSTNPKVGISFPKRDMQRVVTISAIGLLVKWFGEHEGLQLASGLVMAILFFVTFMRFSHGTGWVLGLIGVGVLVLILQAGPGWHLLMWLPATALFGINEWVLRTRKPTYLPAMATVEGGGIKRGLTAPQAAVLIEMPLGKVMALVVLGLLKKGLVRVLKEDPLTVEVTQRYRTSRKVRKKRAASDGIVVHSYEQPFLDRIMANAKPIDQIDLKDAMKSLVMGATRRMKGFDLSDTQEYYRRIVARAWREAESIGEIQQRDKVVDRNLEWMMLDPGYHSRFDHWGSRGYHYSPLWLHQSSAGSTGSTSGSQPATSRTSFGEVTSSFAGWAENTAGRFAGSVEPGSLGLQAPGGILDLSGVDKVTADVFEALSEASQSSGGGGGGGCACAGCACACACAGGGR